MPAKLKAMLVAPFAILIFFLFADFTLKGNDALTEISGLWVKQSVDDFSPTLYVKDGKLSFVEGIEIRDFHLKLEAESLILSKSEAAAGTPLRYSLNGNILKLWWTQNQFSTYTRSNAPNTLDHYLARHGMELELPYLSQYRLMETEDLLCRVGVVKEPAGGWDLTFNGEKVTLDELSARVEKEKERVFMLDQNRFTTIFLADRDVPMSEMDKIRQELRRKGSLHIAEGGYPQGDIHLSPLLYHAVALPRLLPPLNAKVLDKKEIEKAGGKVFAIDLAARNTTPADVDRKLQDFIKTNPGKYVISLEYDGAIPYGQYVETIDMVWKVVYRFRKDLALKKYSASYEKLGDDLQRDIRKTYPMALSETMIK
jgi:biopolymer transport protein ExbD